MKTLKKSLALVLAVVMVVGVLAISASAATYSDDAQIQYKEAVEVLSLVGVIDGKENNNFDPTGTLTRQEAAKIVTYIINQKGADALSKTSSFADVTDGSWAAGYISYCASKGIIAGTGNNKFDPTGTLTGTAWAKILLCAIGFDAEAEGYTNANWAINVQERATKLGLTEGIDGFSYDAAITREEACQMAFNTFGVQTREYNSNGSFNVSGSDVNVSFSASGSYSYGGTVQATYFSKLTDADTTDAFGRPGTKYTLNAGKTNEKSVFVADDAVLTYENTSLTSKAIYNALGLKKSGITATYVVDGATTASFKLTADGTTTVGGNGTYVEIYKTSDTTYKIVEIQEHFDTVASVKTTTDSSTGVSTTTLTLTGKLTSTKITDFAKNTAVIYTVAEVTNTDGTTENVIQSIVAADSITGTLTKIVNNNYTIGGTAYQASKTVKDTLDVAGTSNGNMGKNVSYYVDSFGNLIAAVGAKTSKAVGTYIKVTASDTIKTNGYLTSGDETGTVYGILSDGTYGEYTVNYTDSNKTTKLSAGIYKYTVNDDGEFVISAATTTATAASVTPSTNPTIATDVVANSATTFIFATYNTNNTVKTIDVKTGASNAGTVAKDAEIVYEDGVAVVVFVGGTYSETTTVSDVAYFDGKDAHVKSTATVEEKDGKYVSTTVYTYTAYTAAGDEITLTSEKQYKDAGVYSYNEDNTIAAQVTTNVIKGAVKVYGSTVSVNGTPYSYDADNVCFLGDETTLTDGQQAVAVANTTKGVFTQIWVIADSE
jgi:hypothetical protein